MLTLLRPEFCKVLKFVQLITILSLNYMMERFVDYRADSSAVLGQEDWTVLDIGLAVQIPEGHYGRIAPRSGLAVSSAIDVLAGVVDSSFRGSLKVVFINHGVESIVLRPGDRIAQLILEKISTPPVEVVDELDATERSDKGFGSSGR